MFLPVWRRLTRLGPGGWLGPGGLLGAAAMLVMVTGALPLRDAGTVLDRIWPIMAFLVAVTVVAELADAAGLFEAAADVATRAGRGSVLALWLFAVVLATFTTALLSLDTTAVLLTPVVLALAQRLALPPMPFALATAWLANTGSLLLPVSNLTNLLAVERTRWSAATWAARMWAPALAAILVTVGVLWLLSRGALAGRYQVPTPRPVEHRALLGLAAAACLGFGLAVGAGAPPWIAAGAAALALVAAFARADRARLTRDLVPGRLTLGTVAVFLLVAAAERHGLGTLLHDAAGTSTGSGLADLLQTAGVGAVAANGLNNLPAYLAVEPEAAAGGAAHLLALVIGVNAAPLVTPWASLATLLWRDRCRARGVTVPPLRFAAYGLLLAVPVVLVSTATLALTA